MYCISSILPHWQRNGKSSGFVPPFVLLKTRGTMNIRLIVRFHTNHQENECIYPSRASKDSILQRFLSCDSYHSSWTHVWHVVLFL